MSKIRVVFFLSLFVFSISAKAGVISSGGDPTGEVVCTNDGVADATYVATFHRAFEGNPSVTLLVPTGESSAQSFTGTCSTDEDTEFFSIRCFVSGQNQDRFWVTLASINNEFLVATANKIGDSVVQPLQTCRAQ